MLLLYFGRSCFLTLFQSNYFETTITFSEQLFLQSSCFFLLFRIVIFSQELSFQNSFFFGAKFLPSYNTILRIIVPCYDSCKKNKESKKQSFWIVLQEYYALADKKISIKKEEISSYLVYNIGWKSRTFSVKISWRWTRNQIFRKFSHWENLRLFWMMLNTAIAHL